MNGVGAVRYSAASIILIIAVAVGGAAMAYLSAATTRDQNRKALIDRAATVATALDSEKVAQLQAATDVNHPTYNEIKTKLRLLKQNNTDARSIYLSKIEDGEVYFTADSEVPDAPYYSEPGEHYPDATQTYKDVFKGTTPTVEGPLTDNFGTWVSGLAPVVDLQTGRAVGVVGIDIDAATYNQAIMQSAAVPLLVATVFLVVLVIYEWHRRRQQHELRLRSELMSVASHELRTPITGMRWAAESMLHVQPPEPLKTMAQAMYDSVRNLQAGAEDILQLTRLHKNPKLQLAPTDLVPLVNEICATQRILAGQKRVTINVDATWPKTLMTMCDPARIKQVFHNIVSNAVKYTQPGTSVVLSYRHDTKHHIFTVTDQGIGIPKDEQSRVFEGFYRASNAKSSNEPGTGLGLYLTQTIVRQHHGKITFISQENKGTTFTITLPLERLH